MTVDRWTQRRADDAERKARFLAENACGYCGSYHPSIVNHGPEGFERVEVPAVEWIRYPKKRGRKKR